MTQEPPPPYTARLIYAAMLHAFRSRSARGLLPFEGQWRTRAEIEREIRRRHRRAWIIAFELLVLLAAMSGVALLCVALINVLAF